MCVQIWDHPVGAACVPSDPTSPDIPLPEDCERGAWSRGAEEGKRVPAGIDPSPRPPTSASERSGKLAAPMESQEAPDGPEVYRGFICASFNQDTT